MFLKNIEKLESDKFYNLKSVMKITGTKQTMVTTFLKYCCCNHYLNEITKSKYYSGRDLKNFHYKLMACYKNIKVGNFTDIQNLIQ